MRGENRAYTLDNRKMKKTNITILVFTGMNFVLAMIGSVFNGILDKVAVSLNVTVANAGLLNTMYAYGAAFGAPLTMIVFRKINRVKLMKTMLLIAIAATVVLVSVKSFGVLLAVRLIMGVSVNSYNVLAISLVMSLTDREKQGRTMAILISGNSLAMVVGIPLTRALSSVLDWRDIFWILNIMMTISLIYFHFNLPEGNASAELNLKSELSLLKDRRTLLIIAFTMIMFLGYGGFYTYMTPYLLALSPYFEPVMSIILVFIGAATFIGNGIGGIVSDKIGYAKSMLIGAGFQLTMVILMIIFQPFKWLTLLFTILLVMSAWFTGLQLNTGIAQVTENKSSLMISLNTSALSFGSAIGSSLAAIIITQSGIQNIIFMTLITSFTILSIQFISNKKYSEPAVSNDVEHASNAN